jgi:nicotinamidase-related amidase
MTHPAILDRDRAAVVVIDVQEAFRKAIDGFDAMVDRSAILARGARELGLPIVATEQYPEGLGGTVPEMADALGATERLDKVVFSACRADGFDLGAADQVVVCGIEAHVCVSQTVHDLLDQGVTVHVAVDAIASRNPADRELALRKMERAGAVPTSVETALLELVGRAGTDEFKTVQRLIA